MEHLKIEKKTKTCKSLSVYIPKCKSHKITKFCIPSFGEIVIVKGGNFVLEKSVKMCVNSQVAIRIEADNVNLDLCNFVIEGQGKNQDPLLPQYGIIVKPGIKNFTVKNGTITGVSVGIFFPGEEDTVTKDITLENLDINDNHGFFFIEGNETSYFSCYGILNYSSTIDGFTLRNVNILNNRADKSYDVPTEASRDSQGIRSRAPIHNLLVEDSHFDGNQGTFTAGARFGGSLLGVSYRNHTWRRCTFNNNSDLEYEGQNSTVLPQSGFRFATGLAYEKVGRDNY